MFPAPRLCLRRHAATPGIRRRYLLAVLAILFVGALPGGGPASAQQETPELLGTEGALTLEVRKGRVIRLPRPAATVFVADPEIADVQAQSASIVYLFGRRAGSTSLYAVDESDQLLLSWVVAEALTHLSREHRDVLLECSYRGRPVAEAARRLGVPEGTVKSRTHYALRALRLALEELGVGV